MNIEVKRNLLGCVAKDVISGLEGRVIAVVVTASGMVQWEIQPPMKEGSEPPKPHYIDDGQLVLVDATQLNDIEPPDLKKINVIAPGSRVESIMDGIVGRVPASSVHLNGCVLCSVRPDYSDSRYDAETLHRMFPDEVKSYAQNLLKVIEPPPEHIDHQEEPKKEPAKKAKKKSSGGPPVNSRGASFL
jgi:hypothetical protein